MLGEFTRQLLEWKPLDTWIVISAALAGMACAIPGIYLLLRRQSLMGDALSHTSLLGVVLAFLISGWAYSHGSKTASPGQTAQNIHWLMFAGAVLMGVLAAVLTEAVQKLGRVEATAALGVVFTTMFAAGLLLMRLVDKAHIDVDCVLYGSILDMALNKVHVGSWNVPRAVLLNGAMVVLNLALVAMFFKELQISTFDPELATALGLRSWLINYILMAVTASTIVAVFESVGSIIVIAMLIVPAATAFLLTSHLVWMIPLSLLLCALSAAVGHAVAIALPPVLFPRFGFENVSAASTTGVIAAVSGVFFFLALIFSPKQGLLTRFLHQTRLSLRFASEDLLGLFYRMEELQLEARSSEAPAILAEQLGYRWLIPRLAAWRLLRKNLVTRIQGEYHLTEEGKQKAQGLVRAHRLWESYMAQHFQLSDQRLHQSAHRIEHYLDPSLRQTLASELKGPTADPHGRTIPEEHPNPPKPAT